MYFHWFFSHLGCLSGRKADYKLNITTTTTIDDFIEFFLWAFFMHALFMETVFIGTKSSLSLGIPGKEFGFSNHLIGRAELIWDHNLAPSHVGKAPDGQVGSDSPESGGSWSWLQRIPHLSILDRWNRLLIAGCLQMGHYDKETGKCLARKVHLHSINTSNKW